MTFMTARCMPSHPHMEVLSPGNSGEHSIRTLCRSACCQGHGGWEAGRLGTESIFRQSTPPKEEPCQGMGWGVEP